MITKEQKEEIIKKFAKKPSDTGSPEVQIALLTARRKLLNYLHRIDPQRYKDLIKELNLRR